LDLIAKWTSIEFYSKSEIQCCELNFGTLQLLNSRDFALGHHINVLKQTRENNFAEMGKPCSCEKFRDNHAQTLAVRLIKSENQTDSGLTSTSRPSSCMIYYLFVTTPYSKVVVGIMLYKFAAELDLCCHWKLRENWAPT
jgi:hypothetical protein